MPEKFAAAHVRSFYAASLCGLRFLEGLLASRRLFGAEADARWGGFAGALGPQDRIDLMLRDAAVPWGAAFSSARVFQSVGVAADEAFGPDWPSIDSDTARKLWREAEQAEMGSADEMLRHAIGLWGIEKLEKIDAGTLGSATRLLVGGPSATFAVLLAFLGRDDLSWADQVVVVGSTPAERHLAGLAGLFARSRGPTRIVGPVQDGISPADMVRAAGMNAVDKLVTSNDASMQTLGFARAAADVLG